MRIIAGRHRGAALETPADDSIRPTSDRARQALFNILEHRFGVGEASPLHGARVLDACCGTGAMGLEAMSRGAEACTFMDRDAVALRLAERNARQLKETARCRFVLRDVTRPGKAPAAATLVFLDPPYGEDLAAPALVALRENGWIAPGALVSVEGDARGRLDLPPDFEIVDDRRHGRAHIVLLRA